MKYFQLLLIIIFLAFLGISCSESIVGTDEAIEVESRANHQLQNHNRPVVVMTWNLYFGGGLSAVLRSESVEELIANVTELWAAVERTDFNERAESIAKEIAIRKPDIVGLQEAVLWRTQFPGDFIEGVFTPNAETVAYDFVEILLDALAEEGMHYTVLKIVEGFEGEGPTADFMDVRLTDRDVILARVDHTPQALKYSNPQGANFDARYTIELLGMVEIVSLSNWASVDVKVPDGTMFRFVSTHLSADATELRVAQAAELMSGPLDTPMPTILVGDINSDAIAGEPAYTILTTDGGLTDAWAEVGIGDGLTAHQDNDLLNPESALYKRIDMVLYKGALRALNADVAGDEQKDRTTSGLWPSDHAGVKVKMQLKNPPPMWAGN